MRIFYLDIDCLRPDHLGCYGYTRPTSPAIDSIARQGIRFENYHCASSPCLPSRTALMSGRFGIRNGVVSNHGAGARFNLRTRTYVGPEASNEMLMRHLRANGFHTAGFSNFADRHNAMWFTYGWSEFHTPNLKGGNETAEEVNAVFLPWLKQHARRDNQFVYVNYWDVHRIYKMDVKWADRFRHTPVPQQWPDDNTMRAHQGYRGPFTALAQFAENRSLVPLMPGSVSSRSDFEHMVTGYDAAIAYTDHHLSQVLGELDAQGVLDDAIIIISGDHGDAFGEHGIYSDHVCADECIHHVPLIVRWPGVAPTGGRSDALLSNVDFAPTLCDLLGMPTPEEWDGHSFRPLVEGRDGQGNEFLVWDHALYTVQRAVRTRTHLLVRTYDPLTYPFDPVELYDIAGDPCQTRNLRDEQPGMVDRLRGLMDDWVRQQLDKPNVVPDPLIEVLRERGHPVPE
jgi:choline-sulfatase